MAVHRPLVIGANGQSEELLPGDTLLAHAVDQGNGFISWTGEATVTSSTSVALLDSTGVALSPTKTYKVAACNIDSSAQRGAVALFVGDGSSFTAKTVYEQGTSSSNVQLYLNAGVPSVSVYGGSGSYRIPYRIEEVPNFGQALSEFGILQRLLDAPSDGKTYGRKDAMWVEAGGAAGGTTLKQQVFTSSGTWTRPTGVDSVEVLLVGGGGGGGGTFGSPARSAGGGGGEVKRRVIEVSGASVSVTIGARGSGGATGTAGTGGGASSFGAYLSCAGGGGGKSNGTGGAGGGEGSGGGGAPMQFGGSYFSGGNGAAGSHGFGGGGGGGGGSGSGSTGGGGACGGGGWGSAAAANSGGGGGGGTFAAGFNGGSGICIVTWWE